MSPTADKKDENTPPSSEPEKSEDDSGESEEDEDEVKSEDENAAKSESENQASGAALGSNDNSKNSALEKSSNGT